MRCAIAHARLGTHLKRSAKFNFDSCLSWSALNTNCSGVLTCIKATLAIIMQLYKQDFHCVNTRETDHLCDGHNAQLKLGIHMWFYSSTGNTKSKISLHCWRMRRGYMCIHFMIAPRRLLNRTGNVMFTWKNYNIFLQFQFWFAYGEIFSFNWWQPKYTRDSDKMCKPENRSIFSVKFELTSECTN